MVNLDEDKKVGRKQRPAPDNFIEIYAGLMEGDINKKPGLCTTI